MAEQDRLKFLQSVDGADTSEEGIVKLYESLLPYACIFGLEKSWLGEFNRYCQAVNIEPDWSPSSNFTTFVVFNEVFSPVNSIIGSVSPHSTLLGSGSAHSGSFTSHSGFSGGSSGGGGGFSGGGGGGGGGGGW